MGEGASSVGGDWLSGVPVQYFGIAAGALIFIGVMIIFARMRKIRRECRETLVDRYNTEDIVAHDNLVHYLGLEVFEGKQTRGKGVLLLAQDELFFLRLHPRMELCIPLKRIKRIVTPTTFLDISSPGPLLQVFFQEEGGRVNSAAWKLRDVQSFANSLKLQRKKIQSRKRK